MLNNKKRFEEGKIGEDAYEAYLINNKRFNDKAIEQDEFGQVKNRWYTPPPPSKIDIDKKGFRYCNFVITTQR